MKKSLEIKIKALYLHHIKKQFKIMSTKTIIAIVGLAVLILFSAGVASKCVEVNNTEKTKLESIKAKEKNIANVFDAVWKTISGKAKITENYKEAFKDVYVQIMDARYEKGDGTLMKWIKEANPEFKTNLYEDLSNTIESQRTLFRNEQTEYIDKVRDYNSYVQVFPNSLFLNKTRIEAKIITSSKTNAAVASGVDDDVELFKKDTTKK